MRARCLICCAVVAVLATGAGRTARAGDEPSNEAEVRRVWNARQRQFQTALYRVACVDIRFSGPEKNRTETSMEALMAFDTWTYRFDIHEADQTSKALVLDKKGFHTRPPADSIGSKGPREDSTNLLTVESPWILAYPLLLSHGIVPLPPFSHAGMTRTRAIKRPGSTDGTLRRSKTLEDFRWVDPGEDVEVRVQCAEAVVSGFRIYRDRNQVLRIGIAYAKREGQPIADRYSIEWFGADGSISRRVDAQVKKVTLNEPHVAALFAPPRSRDEVLKVLETLWDVKLPVGQEMSVDDIASLLQQTVGDAIRVRVDQAAFARPTRFETSTFIFDDQGITLGDLMVGKLQLKALDFVFDSYGVAIVPRYVAWESAEGREYLAGDYGISVDELHGAIHNAGNLGDWEDMGGCGSILDNHADDAVFVVHTPSDHIRFSRALKRMPKE